MLNTHRLARRMAAVLALAGLALPTATALAGGTRLEISVTKIKSAKGVIRLAICPPDAGFPDCKDKAVHTGSLDIADGKASIVVTGLAPGSYAVSVFHDANSNGKLDTALGIPKEGYGFSRNPPFKPRAPKFSEAGIELTGNDSTVISLRYIL